MKEGKTGPQPIMLIRDIETFEPRVPAVITPHDTARWARDAEIRRQMLVLLRAEPERYDDCGELNATRLTEDWDNEYDSGEATLDMDHPAWDVAGILSTEFPDGVSGSRAKRPAGRSPTR